MALLGGSTVKDVIWNIFRDLLSPNVEKLINWTGAHDKMALKEMPLTEVLLGMYIYLNAKEIVIKLTLVSQN